MKSNFNSNFIIQNGGLHVVSSGDPRNSNHTSSEPLCINSCGYEYFDNEEERIRIIRPEGRVDWQLIYIQKGKGDFIINNAPMILEKGSLILFAPQEPQFYSYYSSCPTVVFWIHFSGTSVENLMRQYNLFGQNVFQIGEVSFFPEITMKMVRELQLRPFHFLEMCNSYFLELLCNISRTMNEESLPKMGQYEKLFPAIKKMHSNYQNDISVADYANLCGMSYHQFIRKFKECTEVSPLAYLTNLRMKSACNLLLSTNMSISNVAHAVGYKNSLYFSRLFKQYSGYSPLEYKTFFKSPESFH